MGWTGLKERTKGKGGRLGESGGPSGLSVLLLAHVPALTRFFILLYGFGGDDNGG